MFELQVAAGICLVIVGAWFLLQFELAEIILIFFVISGAMAAGIYWLWNAGAVTEVAEGFGIFGLVVIGLGVVRLGIGSLRDMGKARSHLHKSYGASRKPHDPALPH